MAGPRIEHVNVTVSEPERTAALMARLFGWQVRWQGPAKSGGRTIHLGTAGQYLALYAQRDGHYPDGFARQGPLNHIGVEVDDLEEVEARVIEAGLTPFHHGDYEPGRRFYFLDPDGIEFEVISYQLAASQRPQGASAAHHSQTEPA